MRVAVTGATGFVGTRLVRALAAAGHEPVAIVRDTARARARLGEKVEIRAVFPYDVVAIRDAVRGADGVVNLAGENIFRRRWRKKTKAALHDSRVETTGALVQALEGLDSRPEVLISASAVGIYGPRDADAEPIDEDTLDADRFGPADFLADLCQQWERAALEADRLGVRVVLLRFGVVLGRGEGALATMSLPFKLFLGGPVGRGRQIVSWIHIDDLTRLIGFALEHPEIEGVMNAVSPEPVSNAGFSRALGAALGRPSWLPVPPPALHLALGGVASVITTGQRVLPTRALAHGFTFEHPTVADALGEIYDAAAPPS